MWMINGITLKKIYKLNSILIGSIFLSIGCQSVNPNSSVWFWKHETFHAIVESLGSFAAIMLAIFILLILRQNKNISYHFWTACALISMGILDGFHAFVQPGNSFVWLHSIATLLGGMLFALVWLPERFVPSHKINIIPILVATFTILVGISTLFFPDSIPDMLSQENFTLTAKTVNSLGGFFFIVAALRFFLLFKARGKVDEMLFTLHCLLFGIAGLLFHFSKLWDLLWWIWHMLRFVAYLIALNYFVILYQKTNAKLRVEINERKQVEEALLRSEKKYRTLINDVLDTSDVGIFILDSNFSIVWINKALERYFGLRREEVIGKDKRQLIHERINRTFENPDDFKEKVLSAYENNTYIEKFECHVLPDSERKERWLEHWSQPIRMGLYAGGRIEHYTDITERKQAVEKINKLSHAVQQSPSPVIITDTEGNIEYVNPKFTQLTGYTFEEVLGKNPRILKSGETPPEEYKKLWDTITLGGQWRGEFHNKRKDGGLYWESASISSIKNKEGVITHFLAVKEDITQRKKAEEKIKQNFYIQSTISSILRISLKPIPLEELLEQILNTILTIPWLALQSKGCIFLVEENSNELRMKVQKGFSKSHFKACSRIPFDKCLCGRAASQSKVIFTDSVDECHDICYQGIPSHGHYCVPIQLGEKMLGVLYLCIAEGHTRKQDEDEFLLAVAHTLAGIIERKMAEEALKKTYDELKASQAQLIQSEKMNALGTMVAGVAHELINPLMGLINYIQYCMKKTCDGDEKYTILENAERETNRCISIVENLLTFSHMDKDSEEGFQKDSFVVIIDQILNMLSYRIGKEDIYVIKHYIEDIPEIWMRVNSIQQVFLNIITNSLDAMRESEKKELHIGINRKDKYIQVTIVDTGPGITQENLQKIFDPFFTTKPPGKGTGLGLSICQSIIKLHEGNITCKSKPGEGAKFEILLPIEKREEKNESAHFGDR